MPFFRRSKPNIYDEMSVDEMPPDMQEYVLFGDPADVEGTMFWESNMGIGCAVLLYVFAALFLLSCLFIFCQALYFGFTMKDTSDLQNISSIFVR